LLATIMIGLVSNAGFAPSSDFSRPSSSAAGFPWPMAA
jgi:hypothetical protein